MKGDELEEYRRELRRAVRNGDVREQCRLHNAIGHLLSSLGKLPEAIVEHEAELVIAQSLRHTDEETALRRLSECHAERAIECASSDCIDNDSALESVDSAEPISNADSNDSAQHIKLSLKYALRYLSIAREQHDLVEQQRAWTTLGGAFNSSASCHAYHRERTRKFRLEYDVLLDKALGAYQASLKSVDNIESAYQQDAQQFAQSDGEIASPEERTRMRMRAFNNIAAVLELKKDLSKAEEYYRKALKAAEKGSANDIREAVRYSLNFANVQLRQFKYSQASRSVFALGELLERWKKTARIKNFIVDDLNLNKKKSKSNKESAEEDVGHLQSARELAQTECDLWRMRALLSVHEADLDSAHRHLLQALAIAYKLGADSDSEQEEPGDPLESEDTQAIVAKLTSVLQMQKCQQRLFEHYGISLISLKPMPNINERSRIVSLASTAASHAGHVQCALEAEVEVPPFPLSVGDERESLLTTDDLRELTRVLERLGDAASALELYADALVYYRHSVHCATAAASSSASGSANSGADSAAAASGARKLCALYESVALCYQDLGLHEQAIRYYQLKLQTLDSDPILREKYCAQISTWLSIGDSQRALFLKRSKLQNQNSELNVSMSTSSESSSALASSNISANPSSAENYLGQCGKSYELASDLCKKFASKNSHYTLQIKVLNKLLTYHSLNVAPSNEASSQNQRPGVSPQIDALKARLLKLYEQQHRIDRLGAGGRHGTSAASSSSSASAARPRRGSNRSRVIDDSSDSDAESAPRRDVSMKGAAAPAAAPPPKSLTDPDPADFEADECEAEDECDCPRQQLADSDEPMSDAGEHEEEEILDVRGLLESAGHIASNSADGTDSSSAAGDPGIISGSRIKQKKNIFDKRDECGNTPLHKACINGDTATVLRLIQKHGHPVNGRDNAGWQPLHDASFHGHTAIVELLMQLGAGVNERGGEERSTPLMEAISGGSIDTAFALLAIGADPLVRDRSGRRALNVLYEKAEELREEHQFSQSLREQFQRLEAELFVRTGSGGQPSQLAEALLEDDVDDSELEGIIERNRRELEREELGANSDEENNELVDSARKAREDAEKTSRHPLRAYRDAIKHLRSRPPGSSLKRRSEPSPDSRSPSPVSRPKRSFPKFAASNQASEPTALARSRINPASAASSATSHSSTVQPFARPAAPTSISDDNRPLNRPAASALAARPCHPIPIAAPRPRQQQPFFDEDFEAAAGDDDDPLSRMLVNLARTSSDSAAVAAANVPSGNSSGEPTRTAQGAAAPRNTRSVVPVANPTTSEMTEEELDNLVSDIDPALFFDEPSTDSHAERRNVLPQATSLYGTRQPNYTIAAAASEPEFDAASESSRPSGASSSYSRSTTSSGLGSSTMRGSTTSSKFSAAVAGGRPQAAVGIVRPMPSSTASNAAASGASSSSAAAGGTAAGRFGLSEAPRLGRVAIGCVRPMRVVPPATSTTPANPNATRRGGPQGGRSSATNARLLRGGMFNF